MIVPSGELKSAARVNSRASVHVQSQLRRVLWNRLRHTWAQSKVFQGKGVGPGRRNSKAGQAKQTPEETQIHLLLRWWWLFSKILH